MRFLSAALLTGLAVAPAPLTAQVRAVDAAAVVDRYYRALDRGDFRTAYRSWGGEGAASGKSYAAFVRGFADTARTRVAIGRVGRSEGGAGSTYVEVPVDVHATLKNGRRQHFRGVYVIRRVNGIDGATPAQRRWHIDSARLRAA